MTNHDLSWHQRISFGVKGHNQRRARFAGRALQEGTALAFWKRSGKVAMGLIHQLNCQ